MIGTGIGQPGLQHCLETESNEGGPEAPRNSPTRLGWDTAYSLPPFCQPSSSFGIKITTKLIHNSLV